MKFMELNENCNVKVKLILCLAKHHSIKTYCGNERIASRILSPALDGV